MVPHGASRINIAGNDLIVVACLLYLVLDTLHSHSPITLLGRATGAHGPAGVAETEALCLEARGCTHAGSLFSIFQPSIEVILRVFPFPAMARDGFQGAHRAAGGGVQGRGCGCTQVIAQQGCEFVRESLSAKFAVGHIS